MNREEEFTGKDITGGSVIPPRNIRQGGSCEG